MNETPEVTFARKSFLQQVLTVACVLLAVVAGAALLLATIQLWFALLLGILLALFLRSLSNRVERYLKIHHPWALVLVVVILLGGLGLTGWLLAAPLAEQFQQLQQRLPDAWGLLWKEFYESPLSDYLPTHQPAETDVVSAGQSLLPPLTNFFRVTIAFVIGAVISIFLGLYLALNPKAYLAGLLRLFPIRRRPRLQTVLEKIGVTLSRWIFGQLLSMLCVAVLIGLGLYFCGIPLSLAIGLIAGLLDFIPLSVPRWRRFPPFCSDSPSVPGTPC
jgi:predicted PurR-regulated permease PerM